MRRLSFVNNVFSVHFTILKANAGKLFDNVCRFVATSTMRWRNWRRQTVSLPTSTCLTVGVLETAINQLTTTYSQVVYQSPLDHNIISGSSSINSCWCRLMTPARISLTANKLRKAMKSSRCFSQHKTVCQILFTKSSYMTLYICVQTIRTIIQHPVISSAVVIATEFLRLDAVASNKQLLYSVRLSVSQSVCS